MRVNTLFVSACPDLRAYADSPDRVVIVIFDFVSYQKYSCNLSKNISFTLPLFTFLRGGQQTLDCCGCWNFKG